MDNPFLPKEIHLDAVVENTAIGVGTSRDKMAQTYVGNGQYLHWREKQRLFDGDWLIARVCGILPQKVAEAGWDLKLGETSNDKLKESIKTYIERLFINNSVNLPEGLNPLPQQKKYNPDDIIDNPRCGSLVSLFTRAQTIANVEDGCAIVINVDDGQDPSQPILKKNIKRIVGFDILTRKEIRPAWEYTRDPFEPVYYNILMERRPFTSLNSMAGKNIFVHRSRVLRFDGLTMVSEDRLRNNEGWTGSIIDKIWEDFKQWRLSLSSTSNTLSDGSLFVYMLRGLRELVSQGKEAYLQKRIQLMVQNMSQLGGIAVDSTDEQVNFLSRNYGGMYQILEQFVNMIVAATGLPHTLVLGESPSGLGATGESEMKAIEDLKREMFDNEYKDKLTYIYRLIFLAKDSPTKGKEPKNWSIEYQGNYEPTIQEKLANTNALVSALSGAIASQFLTPEEARLPFKGTTTTWGIVLDDKLWEKQKEEQQQMGMGQDPMMGGEMMGQDPSMGQDPNMGQPPLGGGAPQGNEEPPQGEEEDQQIAPNDVLMKN